MSLRWSINNYISSKWLEVESHSEQDDAAVWTCKVQVKCKRGYIWGPENLPLQRWRPQNINPLWGNLQGCLSARYVGLDTNPLSHKSAKAERDSPSIKSQLPSTCLPRWKHCLRVCVCVCVCVTVYYHLCKYPQQTTLYYPTASVPAGQPAVICSAEGYECWHFTDMTCRSFLNYRNPKVPEDDDDGPPNQMPVYSWFHRCSEGIPPHHAGQLFCGTPPMNL